MIYTNEKDTYKDKKIRSIITVFIVISCIVFIACTFFATADKEHKENYTAASVRVHAGDTLSSIAKEYCGEESLDTAISDIIKINNMTSTVIYAGQDLLVPVYF